MTKRKVVRFRCHCFECDSDDERADDASQSGAAELNQDNKGSDEVKPRLIPDAIGKLLFGA